MIVIPARRAGTNASVSSLFLYIYIYIYIKKLVCFVTLFVRHTDNSPGTADIDTSTT